LRGALRQGRTYVKGFSFKSSNWLKKLNIALVEVKTVNYRTAREMSEGAGEREKRPIFS
jgi:hypothetical protein